MSTQLTRRLLDAGAPPGTGPALGWAVRLSVILAVVMTAAASAGLLVDGLYQDGDAVSAMLRGYDLVTLVVAVPALAVSLLPPQRHSARGQLVWIGMLGYSAYNSAIYVFGTAFNDLFLVHVAEFSLSVFALGLVLANIDVGALAAGFGRRVPVRSVASILLVLGVGLGAMWVFYSLRYAVTGQAPRESMLVLPAANQHLGYLLDLALVVPVSVLAVALLWRRAGWGYLLAGVVAVFGLVYQLNYMVALWFQASAGVPGATAFDRVEPVIAVAYLLAVLLLFGSVRRGGRPGSASA